jgi:hypothetical protein
MRMDALLGRVRHEGVRTRSVRLWEEPPPEAYAGGTGVLVVPRAPEDLAAHYDLTLSHPDVDMAPFAAFERWLAEAAAARGLSCALLHDGVVREAVRRLEQGRLSIGYHLDYYALWHVAGDPYARLSEAVQDAGGRPVNPPERARHFTDKAVAHAELLRRGLGVPESFVLGPSATEARLPAAARARLRLDEPGACVYVKPANGFGSRGVIRVDRTDVDSLSAALAAVRTQAPDDAVLIQREVVCPRLRSADGVERPAYWRVLYCLGEIIPFWWNKQEAEVGRPSYRRLTAPEIGRARLGPVLDFVLALADLSGLDWFSTELCLSEGAQGSRFTVRGDDGRLHPVVAIDYLNDQCDVDVQSRWAGGPPDAVVRHAAERFADAAWQQQQVLPLPRWQPTALRPAA